MVRPENQRKPDARASCQHLLLGSLQIVQTGLHYGAIWIPKFGPPPIVVLEYQRDHPGKLLVCRFGFFVTMGIDGEWKRCRTSSDPEKLGVSDADHETLCL